MIFPPQPNDTKHTDATFGGKAFNCPHCSAYAEQKWFVWKYEGPTNRGHRGVAKAQCQVCDDWSWWLLEPEPARMVWPPRRPGIPPHREMPAATKQLYEEARDVANASPRAAVALLRVAADVLLREVLPHAGDKPFNALIGDAVKAGLSPVVQIALDVLRAHGNDAVHPVQLVVDEADAPEKVTALCRQLNLVVEQLVAVPRQQREAFDALPESVRAQIAKRDGTS